MWIYIKYLFQLILAPSRGWEDVAASGSTFEKIVRPAFISLACVTALSEFMPLAYVHSLTFAEALGSAIAIGGGIFASLYAARLFLDILLSRHIDPNINKVKIGNITIYMVGLDCVYRIFANLLPASLTFLSFLPLISIIILFKSSAYIGIGNDQAINYIAIGFTGVVIIPVLICWILTLII